MTVAATKFAAVALVVVGVAWFVAQRLEPLLVAAHAIGA